MYLFIYVFIYVFIYLFIYFFLIFLLILNLFTFFWRERERERRRCVIWSYAWKGREKTCGKDEERVDGILFCRLYQHIYL